MDICEYNSWFHAIKDNDALQVKRYLQEANEKTKGKLLHGPSQWKKQVDHGFWSKSGRNLGNTFKISHPWTVGAAYCSIDVMDIFLQHNVNVEVTDIYGNNVVHILCFIALEKDEKEEEELIQVYKYLVNSLKESKLESLLFQENNNGLRPLELCSVLGVFSLFQPIFQTKGVYIKHEISDGLVTEQWFDITEYESPTLATRAHLSPLLLVRLLDQSRLEHPATEKCLKSEYIQMWMKSKIRCSWFPIVIWLLLKFLHGYVFFYVETFHILYGEREYLNKLKEQNRRYDNITETCVSTSMDRLPQQKIIFYICLGLILLSTITWITKWLWINVQWKRRKFDNVMQMPRRQKTLQVQIGFLVLAESYLFCGGFIYVVIMFAKFVGDVYIPRSLEEIIVHLITTGIAVSLLQMTQIFASSVLFLVGIEKILNVLMTFMLSILIFMAPHVMTLHRIMSLQQAECFEGRRQTYDYLYVSFKTILNMVSYEDLADQVPERDLKFTLYMQHVVFVCVFSISLINYLIATASNYLAFVWKNQHVIATIQQLSTVSSVMESGWVHLCLRWWDKIAKPKYFITKEDRIYITQVIVAGKDCGKQL